MNTATSSLTSNADRWLLRACVWLPLAALLLFFALPMLGIGWRSLVQDSDGSLGAGNYAALLNSPGIWRAVGNSLMLGVSVTLLTLLMATVLAYGLERTAMLGKRFISIAMALPVLAPSLVLGLGLIFLLGRGGVLARLLDIRPEIYGFWGLLLANVLYALPEAVLIVRAALRHGDARQYEAAEVMGAGALRQFIDITLPGMTYGLLSAGFVVFTITITDFGNAVVIGGNFPVLATEIYNQVNGQMKFGLGSAVGILLLLPAALSVWIDRVAAHRQGATTLATPPALTPRTVCDKAFLITSLLICGTVYVVIGTVVVASFIELWPYKLAFTLKHYDITISGGYTPLWTSIIVSLLAAVLGTLLLCTLAFGTRRLPGPAAHLANLLSVLPVGVPGLVLGLAYIFTFNSATMPWGVLYGSMVLLALCNYYHYHTQGYVIMMTGMRNISTALEDATAVLGGGTNRVLRDVYLPALRITLLSVAIFLFMRSMVTLAAVIFLVTPSLSLASVTVMRLDEAGLTSEAAAFSTCIMVIVGTMALVLHWVTDRMLTTTSSK